MEISGIWGQFSIALDEKGRLSLPSKIRGKILGERLILTKGAERCLWLYLPDRWERVSAHLVSGSSIYSLSTQDVLRRFIAPAEEILIDKTGRIKLSSSLMKSVGLGRDCCLLGMGERLELWDLAVYENFEEEKASQVRETWEGLASLGKDS